MARQLAFDLPAKTALGREDFFVSDANRHAVGMLENWQACHAAQAGWPGGKLILHGPEGCGKTHLAHVWAAESGARIVAAETLSGNGLDTLATGPVAIEDADRIAGDLARETLLFHLHNLMQTNASPLLITARRPAARWPLALPDLASRMQGTLQVAIAPPDDRLLAAMLVKLFADRQVAVRPRLIEYLLHRIERSFAAARRVVAELDAAALTEGRPITLPLAAQVLDKDNANGA